jgi:imidazole glycerol phosphate synthase subunit HisF
LKEHDLSVNTLRNGTIRSTFHSCFITHEPVQSSAMIAKRVIPCLDVHDGQVTRGVQFGKAEAGELRNVGDPVALALRYNEQGADEMVFFDITASAHGRATMVDVIERTADQCFMPLTVGGGIKSVDDMYTMLRAGADKINASSSPSMQKESRATNGESSLTAAAKTWAWTPSNGPKKPSPSALAKSS